MSGTPADLATWLRAQLDADERIAKAAKNDDTPYPTSGRWLPQTDSDGECFLSVDGSDRAKGCGCCVVGTLGPEEVAHITRHDPAHVLADIEVKRRIIGHHGPAILNKGAGADYFVTARVCLSCGGSDAWYDENTPVVGAAKYPCPTLRLLAAPFADRPGYLPEWKPA